MKIKDILLLSSIGLASFLTACSSDADFLTEKPLGTLTIENGYNSSDQIVATLLSAYNINDKFFFITGFGDEFTYKQAGTDMLDGKWDNPHYSNFKSYWSTTSGHVKTIWDDYYKMISFCNIALDKADVVSWNSDAEKARVLAEAHFLRGMAYLRLANYYGAVPLVKEFTEAPRFDYERTPRADVYKFAIDELVEAYNSLPDTPTVDQKYEYGRAGKGAAAYFLSEAFLSLGVEDNNCNYYGGKDCWKNAAEFAQAVINLHPMMESRFGERLPSAKGSKNGVTTALPEGSVVSDLYVASNIISPSNTEAVWVSVGAKDYESFSKVNAGFRSITLGLSPAVQDLKWKNEYKEAGAGDGPWNAVSAKYGSQLNPFLHGGTGWAQYIPTWYAGFDMWNAENNFASSKDDRYKEGITVHTKYLCLDDKHSKYEQLVGWGEFEISSNSEATKFCPVFYKETPMDGWDFDEVNPNYMWYFPVPRACIYRSKYIIRTAGAYLLLAEAQMRGGVAGAALASLNKVRLRANAAPATKIDMQVILDERARELIMEEDRWATLLRMEPENWKPRIKNYGLYTAAAGARQYPEICRFSQYTEDIPFNLWPVPQDYMDLNSGLQWEQNKGW